MVRVIGSVWRWFGGIAQRVGGVGERVGGAVRSTRSRRPVFDHLMRAYERYQEQRGDRLAAGVTYFGFLSFFPLLALAYALLGFAVGASEWARSTLVEAIGSLLPGLAGRLPVEQIAQARTTAGLIGVIGLVVTGLGSIGALRESLREIWRNDPTGGGHLLVKKLWDIGMLIYLGLMLILSVTVSTVAAAATHGVLDLFGLERVTGMGTVLRLLSIGIAIGFNTLIFLVLFSRLSGTRAPWRRIIRGALLGAVGFELLKLVATLLLAPALRNPVYGPFALTVGLLIWINVVARFVLFAAAWTATRRVILSADAANPEQLSRVVSADSCP
jgi:membrane protein